MFTSTTAIRRQKDPRPYFIAETGERVDESAFGTPGVTIAFSPRSEYMLEPANPVNEILDHVRDYYKTSDPWGSSMFWLAIIAGWVEELTGTVPTAWRTDLPPVELGVLAETVAQLAPADALAQLEHAGAVLQRIADAAELAGKDYELVRASSDD